MSFIPSPSFATDSAQACALNVELAVREFLGTIEQAQEKAVYVGHKPHEIVDYILSLESEKVRVVKAARAFDRILEKAAMRVAKMTEELRN